MKQPKVIKVLNKTSKKSKKNTKSWPEAFRQCKLVLYSQTFDTNKDICVHAGDENLLKMFGHDASFRLVLDDLVGPMTCTKNLVCLKAAIEQGNCISCYLNLYRVDGSIVSCHVTVSSIGKSTTKNDTRWAVMTIRHACSVANALNLNISFFGSKEISEAAKCYKINDVVLENQRVLCQEEMDNSTVPIQENIEVGSISVEVSQSQNEQVPKLAKPTYLTLSLESHNTILAEAGLTMHLVKNAGDWKSGSVAEGYIDTSDRIKQTIADAFSNFSSSIAIEEEKAIIVPSNKAMVVADENINPNCAKNYFVFNIA